MNKSTYVAILKTDSVVNPKERFCTGAYDYCDFIFKVNLHANSCYFNWEILKLWKL